MSGCSDVRTLYVVEFVAFGVSELLDCCILNCLGFDLWDLSIFGLLEFQIVISRVFDFCMVDFYIRYAMLLEHLTFRCLHAGIL